jgi:hypothetical protein
MVLLSLTLTFLAIKYWFCLFLTIDVDSEREICTCRLPANGFHDQILLFKHGSDYKFKGRTNQRGNKLQNVKDIRKGLQLQSQGLL